MDQKNTIVKCNAKNCLYKNSKGECDQYVIHINGYGCQDYVECEVPEEMRLVTPPETCADCVHRDNTGLMHAYCQLQEMYMNRSAEVCDAFEKRIGNFRKGKLSMCWWCDYFNSDRKTCGYRPAPDIDNQGKCHSIQSTGANQ